MQSEQKNKQTELMDIKVDETLYRQAQQVASWYGLTIDQAIYYCFRAILALPESARIAYLTELLEEYRAARDERFDERDYRTSRWPPLYQTMKSGLS